MELLQNILDNSNFPFLSALILGLMTAISPCPLATNITAIAFISKDIENKKRIFTNGIIYTLGRAFSYSTLGIILYLGVDILPVKKVFFTYGERFIGPLLIIIGIFMLDFIKLKLPGFLNLSEKIENKSKSGSRWSAFLLGAVFALAFCPYSGVLFFGMLIPMTISSTSGLSLPVIYAIATGLPVIIIAYILAFSISGIGNFYNKVKAFEKWFRIVVAVVFILVGLYYIFTFYIARLF